MEILNYNLRGNVNWKEREKEKKQKVKFQPQKIK